MTVLWQGVLKMRGSGARMKSAWDQSVTMRSCISEEMVQEDRTRRCPPRLTARFAQPRYRMCDACNTFSLGIASHSGSQVTALTTTLLSLMRHMLGLVALR